MSVTMVEVGMMKKSNSEILEEVAMIIGVDPEMINTFQGWKENGMQVQKGQKALFATKTWIPSKNKKTKRKEDDEENEKLNFWAKKTSLFTIDQVAPI